MPFPCITVCQHREKGRPRPGETATQGKTDRYLFNEYTNHGCFNYETNSKWPMLLSWQSMSKMVNKGQGINSPRFPDLLLNVFGPFHDSVLS